MVDLSQTVGIVAVSCGGALLYTQYCQQKELAKKQPETAQTAQPSQTVQALPSLPTRTATMLPTYSEEPPIVTSQVDLEKAAEENARRQGFFGLMWRRRP